MIVEELIRQLKEMPSNAYVYNRNSQGVKSAKLIFTNNLLDCDHSKTVEYFVELITYYEDHSSNLDDSKIRSRTGFKNRDELIDAYLALKNQTSKNP